MSDDAWQYTLDMPHQLRAPRIARRTVRMILAEHGLHELIDTAELLTSELVTNAVRYSDGPASVRVLWARGRLRISVCDTNPKLPVLDAAQVAGDDEDCGRGLALVQLCADAWDGYAIGEELFGIGGKLIWFEMVGPASRSTVRLTATADRSGR
ncbi:ATP-binding protein [Streptomyces sp. NBS 14/10]|uniref:ATP-binding protein n=1 Tax=Streptomyces sp. NBS 14/10 TaxID=1945643 RepID=UPI00117E8498|nr:ATP-binding protein [Streptomyces sp. NBS 14/10]KAK1182383.1 ATP-binding protein [Streptomyces sp. NBS 14/10]